MTGETGSVAARPAERKIIWRPVEIAQVPSVIQVAEEFLGAKPQNGRPEKTIRLKSNEEEFPCNTF
jgi:hypothetical protein